jgi:cob(I)alamin adenosyltransferase
MKIYTKTGDTGTTSLLKGGRVEKHHPRVEAYGTFDELNSFLGYARAQNKNDKLELILKDLQNQIFTLCSDVAAEYDVDKPSSKIPRIDADDVQKLEDLIDKLNEDLDPLRAFILPGGSQVASILHIARTVCRRGERNLTFVLEGDTKFNEFSLQYANRLSDLLFTLARWINVKSGYDDVLWEK